MADLSWPLQRAAEQHAGSPAVAGRTYGELAGRVGALGAALPGERIGWLGANSPAHLEAWLAIPAYGGVLVDLNHRLAPEELAFMAEDAGLDVLVADAERLEVARGLGPPVLEEAGWEALADGEPADPPGLDPGALAAISYTGGTTGRPKGVMLSHGNLLANAQHNMVATGHGPADVWLHFCPFFHVAGTSNVFAATWAGARHVVLPRFDPGEVLAAIERERVTHTVFVPTMLAMLLEHPGFADADLGSLEHIQYAASPISPELQRRVLDAFPGCDVAQFYGMTEAAPTVTHLTAADHRAGERLRSMGAPVPGVQVQIRDPLGSVLPPGDVGELWLRGDNVMLGYWNRPDATAEALVDGWYRSGDIARADEGGYLYMVDRAKDMIITGGENVYSIEVETVLSGHPAVREAAVFGVPHERWGEAVHAVVVAEAVEPGELIEHCRARIAGFKVPRAIDVRAEPLPKSGAGKVLKSVLREPHWTGRDSGLA